MVDALTARGLGRIQIEPGKDPRVIAQSTAVTNTVVARTTEQTPSVTTFGAGTTAHAGQTGKHNPLAVFQNPKASALVTGLEGGAAQVRLWSSTPQTPDERRARFDALHGFTVKLTEGNLDVIRDEPDVNKRVWHMKDWTGKVVADSSRHYGFDLSVYDGSGSPHMLNLLSPSLFVEVRPPSGAMKAGAQVGVGAAFLAPGTELKLADQPDPFVVVGHGQQGEAPVVLLQALKAGKPSGELKSASHDLLRTAVVVKPSSEPIFGTAI